MKNTVELVGYYGSDETHALSAWTSTSRDLTDEKRARIPQLLKMLADNNHRTPFEKSSLHFLVRTDIATHIHIIKHRIGVSVNAGSARYKELKEPTFLTPDDWPEEMQHMLVEFCGNAERLYHDAVIKLERYGLSRARAKESARMFMPYATQIQADVMFNWNSFKHFLDLRMKPNAQKEIRDIATEMLRLVAAIRGNPFKHTISAFGYENPV